MVATEGGKFVAGKGDVATEGARQPRRWTCECRRLNLSGDWGGGGLPDTL